VFYKNMILERPHQRYYSPVWFSFAPLEAVT